MEGNKKVYLQKSLFSRNIIEVFKKIANRENRVRPTPAQHAVRRWEIWESTEGRWRP
jgi:hypothetical protein